MMNLDDDDWKEDVPAPAPSPVSVPPTIQVSLAPLVVSPVMGDSGIITREEPSEKFRELFVENTPDQAQTLDGLPLKELRRMATERGILGSAEMKKKELISALRSVVHPSLAPLEANVEKEDSILEVPELT